MNSLLHLEVMWNEMQVKHVVRCGAVHLDLLWSSRVFYCDLVFLRFVILQLFNNCLARLFISFTLIFVSFLCVLLFYFILFFFFCFFFFCCRYLVSKTNICPPIKWIVRRNLFIFTRFRFPLRFFVFFWVLFCWVLWQIFCSHNYV